MKRGGSFIGRKSGQVAVFVVVALVIVAGIAGFFLLKDRILVSEVPADMKPAYEYYKSCAEAKLSDGAKMLGSQAGYLEMPDFEPGSQYAPFSNQLDFFGIAVPYWYYISGNGIAKEQVPTKKQMQNQLADYLEKEMKDKCDFTEFLRQGYLVKLGEAEASTTISADKVSARISQAVTIAKIAENEEEERTATIKNHKIEINSVFGRLYETAKAIYNHQKEEMVLENYAVDVLNLYAPVTGTEISCSPLIWIPDKVIEDLQNGLEANVQALKVKGDYYKLSKDENKYFVIEPGVELAGGERVGFLYNKNWPSRFEVWPTKSGAMIADAVGPSQGLSAAGFCYASYKFVYDMHFPVLVQVYYGDNAENIFQFPVAVVVSKNQPREAANVQPLVEEAGESVCENANTEIGIYTYDTSLAPVEADIDFKCLADVCSLGRTNITSGNGDALLTAKVPQCVNARLIASAEDYKEESYLISTNEESIADIVMNKKHNLEVEIYVDSKKTSNLAVLSISENLESGESRLLSTIAYPANAEAELAEGDYTFDLKVYTQKSYTIPETNQKTCAEVPKEGALGVLGFTEEKCFEYTLPSQTLSQVLYAGGSQVQYVTLTELEGATKLKIYAESVELPSSVEKIADAYNLVELKNLDITII